MHNPGENRDRRTIKTISALRTALIGLILEKRYDAITVQDIIDRANVGRSTFYTHFRDKEDVLVGDWKRFLNHLVENIDLEQAGRGRFVPVREFMLHLKEFHAFYRALVRSGKDERLFSLGTAYLADGIEAKIVTATGQKDPPSVPPAVCANFLAIQIFALVKWWLDRNMPYSPEEMDKMFHRLVAPGVVSTLGNDNHELAQIPARSARH